MTVHVVKDEYFVWNYVMVSFKPDKCMRMLSNQKVIGSTLLKLRENSDFFQVCQDMSLTNRYNHII